MCERLKDLPDDELVKTAFTDEASFCFITLVRMSNFQMLICKILLILSFLQLFTTKVSGSYHFIILIIICRDFKQNYFFKNGGNQL